MDAIRLPLRFAFRDADPLFAFALGAVLALFAAMMISLAKAPDGHRERLACNERMRTPTPIHVHMDRGFLKIATVGEEAVLKREIAGNGVRLMIEDLNTARCQDFLGVGAEGDRA